MSGNHAWRTSGELSAARIGLAVFVTGVMSTSAIATQRQVIPDPVVLAETGVEQLPAAANDDALVHISPQLEAAPKIFDGKAMAVWDGRGTLPGVWVAHPLAKTAQRVRIYNLENGAIVDGAMFKREAVAGDNRVIISSDAAEKLGLKADIGARLRVVGVRPATRPAADDGKNDAAEAAGPDPDKTAGKAGSAGPVPANEGTADAAGQTGPDAKRPDDTNAEAPDDGPAERAATADGKTGDAGTAVAGSGPPDGPDATVDAVPDEEMYATRNTGVPPIPRARPNAPGDWAESGGSTSGLPERALDAMANARAAAGFKFVPASESDSRLTAVDGFFTRAAAPADPEGVAGDGAAAGAGGVALLTEPDRGNAGGADPVHPATATTGSRLPSDPGTPIKVKAEAAPPLFKSVPDLTPKAGADDDNGADDPAPKTAAARAVTPDSPDETAAPGTAAENTDETDEAAGDGTAALSALDRPFVQVGLFGLPENAERLVEKLKSKGIPAIPRPTTAGGKEFSRVLVGPFKDRSDRDRVLEMVRELGLTDAMPVKG